MRVVTAFLALALGLQPSLALAGWKALAPIESPRANLGAAALQGEIYVAGGHGLQGPSSTFESFDPKANLWRPLPSMPQAVSDFGIAALDGLIYVVGGYGTAERDKPVSAVWIYDPDQARWMSGPALPSARAGHALVAVDKRLFLLGGEGPQAARIFVLEAGTGSWSVAPGPMPRPRAALAAALLGTEIYVVGGQNSAAVDIYDTLKGTWRAGPALPGPRSGAVAASFGGTLHVTGGQQVNPFKTFADHLVLAPKSGAWRRGAEMPTPRHGAASAVLDGAWYVVGGGRGAGVFTEFTVSDVAEVYRGD